MQKFIDIIPPKPKKTPRVVKSKRLKAVWFLLTLFIALVLIFLARMLPALRQNPNNINSLAVTVDSKSTTEKELIDSPKGSKVRIINASGDDQVIQKVSDLVKSNSFEIEQTSKVDNRYKETIIYYKNGSKETAEKLQKIFEPSFLSKTEESETLSEAYDFFDYYWRSELIHCKKCSKGLN